MPLNAASSIIIGDRYYGTKEHVAGHEAILAVQLFSYIELLNVASSLEIPNILHFGNIIIDRDIRQTKVIVLILQV